MKVQIDTKLKMYSISLDLFFLFLLTNGNIRAARIRMCSKSKQAVSGCAAYKKLYFVYTYSGRHSGFFFSSEIYSARLPFPSFPMLLRSNIPFSLPNAVVYATEEIQEKIKSQKAEYNDISYERKAFSENYISFVAAHISFALTTHIHSSVFFSSNISTSPMSCVALAIYRICYVILAFYVSLDRRPSI